MLFKQIILFSFLCIGGTLLAQQKNNQTKAVKDGFEISIHTTKSYQKPLKKFRGFFIFKKI
jgi:hypothetical protein